MIKDPINLSALGELEAAIMEVIWQLETASVRQVLNQLRKTRQVAYTTVMTVMSRLNDKKILQRQQNNSGAYVYRPVMAKEKFLASVSQKAISGLIKKYGDVAVAQFIDLIESSNSKQASQWRKQLKKIR